MKRTIICIKCGNPFVINKERRIKTAKFCSNKCKSDYSKVITKCSNCGKEKIRTKGYLKSKRSTNSFCSKKCRDLFCIRHGSWNKGINSTETICDWCGGKIIKPLSILRQYKNHFCCEECYANWQSKNKCGSANNWWKSIESSCDYCGKKIFLQPCKKRVGKNHFCSRKCSGNWKSKNIIGENHPSWRGGFESSRGSNWLHQRKKVFERDGCVCKICAKTENLKVHHIIPFRKYGLAKYEEANVLENLMVVCHSCHMKIESRSD